MLGFGRNILFHYRTQTEKIINEFLEKYAPTKIIEIHGMEIEVSSAVSCLSNEDYNKKHGTNLKNSPTNSKVIYSIALILKIKTR